MGERVHWLCRFFGHTDKHTHPAHRTYRLWPLSGLHGDGKFDVEARCDRCRAIYRIGFARLGTADERSAR